MLRYGGDTRKVATDIRDIGSGVNRIEEIVGRIDEKADDRADDLREHVTNNGDSVVDRIKDVMSGNGNVLDGDGYRTNLVAIRTLQNANHKYIENKQGKSLQSGLASPSS